MAALVLLLGFHEDSILLSVPEQPLFIENCLSLSRTAARVSSHPRGSGLPCSFDFVTMLSVKREEVA